MRDGSASDPAGSRHPRDAGVSVVAPVYNNAATLPELHRRILAALGSRPVEVILVDDQSTDESRTVAQMLGARLVPRRQRGGANAAVLAGLAAATQPLCCVLDADLEDPPEALPAMLAALDPATARVVFSSRDEPQPWSSRVFRFIVRALFPTLPPKPCLCFAIDRETREALVAVARETDYLPAVIGMLGVPTAVVSVRRGARPGGGSGYSTWRRLRYGLGMTWSAVRLKLR